MAVVMAARAAFLGFFSGATHSGVKCVIAFIVCDLGQDIRLNLGTNANAAGA